MASILNLPRFRIFIWFKVFFLRVVGASVSYSVVIYPKTWILATNKLSIGKAVDLARGVFIDSRGGVVIGDDTLIGYNSSIFTANHEIPNQGEPFPITGKDFDSVNIGKNTWVGANVIFLPGSGVGSGCLVAAGSVVTKRFEDDVIIAGNPARIIKTREL